MLALLAAAPHVVEGQRIAPVAAVPPKMSSRGHTVTSVDVSDEVTPRRWPGRLVCGLVSGAVIGAVFAHIIASSPITEPDARPHVYAYYITGTTLGITVLSLSGHWPCPGDC